VWLKVLGRNERAQRSYAACGFTEEGRLRAQVWSGGEYDDLVHMGILRVEWERLMNSRETQERRILF